MKTLKLFLIGALAIAAVACEDEGNNTPLTGTGGSLARFAQSGNHLYVVNNTSLVVFEILPSGELLMKATTPVGIGIETITVRGVNLYIGSTNALYIYDITDALSPTLMSTYTHIVSCDPVVVQGDYAYATLRAGTTCRSQGQSLLEVIDISSVAYPALLRSYVMQSPYGLGIDDNALFVCEGDFGLKVFDATDPVNVFMIKTYPDIHAYDVIANNGNLILTGNDGIFQYDYSDLQNITQRSHLTIQP